MGLFFGLYKAQCVNVRNGSWPVQLTYMFIDVLECFQLFHSFSTIMFTDGLPDIRYFFPKRCLFQYVFPLRCSPTSWNVAWYEYELLRCFKAFPPSREKCTHIVIVIDLHPVNEWWIPKTPLVYWCQASGFCRHANFSICLRSVDSKEKCSSRIITSVSISVDRIHSRSLAINHLRILHGG